MEDLPVVGVQSERLVVDVDGGLVFPEEEEGPPDLFEDGHVARVRHEDLPDNGGTRMSFSSRWCGRTRGDMHTCWNSWSES